MKDYKQCDYKVNHNNDLSCDIICGETYIPYECVCTKKCCDDSLVNNYEDYSECLNCFSICNCNS